MKSGARKPNIKARIVVLASYANEIFLAMTLRDDTNYDRLLRQDKDADYMNIDGTTYKNAYFFDGYPYLPFAMRSLASRCLPSTKQRFINVGNVILTHLFSPGNWHWQ